jgi:adenosine deaminase
VGHLGIIQRIKPEKECLQWVDFFIEHKDFFVGVDLADDESFAPSKTFSKIFAPVHNAGMQVTIHAGESAQDLSPQNVMDAVEVLGAKRIGHGLQIISRPDICAHLSKLKIPLELCPWSNYLTQSILRIEDHPIRKLMDLGLRTTINTDDPGIFDIDLTHEYELLAKHFAFTENDFNLTNNWAAEASFISLSEKQRVWPRAIST